MPNPPVRLKPAFEWDRVLHTGTQQYTELHACGPSYSRTPGPRRWKPTQGLWQDLISKAKINESKISLLVSTGPETEDVLARGVRMFAPTPERPKFKSPALT